MQATRTYLELKDRTQFKASFGDFPEVAIVRPPHPSPDLYRMCYRTVGEAFHWFDRWDWSDEEIATHLADPAIPAEFGRGFGKHLLSSAVRDAWSLRPRRVWLHTCTLDHPNALPNYLARGFTPYRTETYEVDSAS